MSLLIKGVQVVDGVGSPPYKADVLVQRNLISAIGDLKRRRAVREIDGLGNYLAPGFIDIHATSDHFLTLFSNPAQNHFTNQGITTIIGGHCGASLAPLLYGNLQSIRKWTDPNEINVNWHTVAEFLKILDRIPLGVNFGTLIGHSTIRRDLVGENSRPMRGKELPVFKRILKDSLEEGAYGLSTGLGYVHGQNIRQGEIKALAEIVAQYDGVYSTHLRDDEEGIISSVDETIKLAKSTRVKTLISHFYPIKGFEEKFRLALTKIEKNAASASIYFETYDWGERSAAIYLLLPKWAKEGNLEAMLKRLENKKTRERILKEIKEPEEFKFLMLASVPEHPYLLGKTIGEIAADSGETEEEALLRIMQATRLRATVWLSDVDRELADESLLSGRALISAHNNAGLPNEVMHSRSLLETFPMYLDFAVKQSSMPIEAAIKKITLEPARLLGLTKRGAIKERNIADLVVIGKSDYKVKHTILGGKVVGEEETRGQVLRHGG